MFQRTTRLSTIEWISKTAKWAHLSIKSSDPVQFSQHVIPIQAKNVLCKLVCFLSYWKLNDRNFISGSAFQTDKKGLIRYLFKKQLCSDSDDSRSEYIHVSKHNYILTLYSFTYFFTTMLCIRYVPTFKKRLHREWHTHCSFAHRQVCARDSFDR